MKIPKLGIIIPILGLIAYCNAHAENETELADSIEQICAFQDETKSIDSKEDCMLYYVNCVVGKGGKWTDKVLFKCMKEKKKDDKATDSIL